MPEAHALKSAQPKNEQSISKEWVSYTDDGLADFQKSVANKLESAGVPHNVVPISEYQPELPVHVPDGKTVNTSKEEVHPVKGSYGEFETPFTPMSELSEHLAFADRLVRGEHHVIDASHRFNKQKEEKEQKRLEHANAPKNNSKGPVKKIVDWLHR